MQAQPVKSNYQDWIIKLSGQVGVSLPPEIKENLSNLSSITDINKNFFEWYDTYLKKAPSLDLSQEILSLMTIKFDFASSREYQDLTKASSRAIEAANNYSRDGQRQLTLAATYRETINQKMNKGPIEMSMQVSDIIKSGWFKLEPQTSLRLSEGGTPCIIFSTPDVTLTYKKPDAKIDLSVYMGQYQVQYYPTKNNIRVVNHYDTRAVNSYIHPHVGSEGEVCWGNAAESYSKAMNACYIIDAFIALKIILTTYNEDSPYAGLERFHYARNPELAPTEYRLYSSREEYINDLGNERVLDALLDASYRNSDGETCEVDDSDCNMLVVKTYRKYFGGVLCDTQQYFKVSSGGSGIIEYKLISDLLHYQDDESDNNDSDNNDSDDNDYNEEEEN